MSTGESVLAMSDELSGMSYQALTHGLQDQT